MTVWNIEGQLLRTFEGYSMPILTVEWSPDSRHIASICLDGVLRIWCLLTGECISVIETQGECGILSWLTARWIASVGKNLVSIWDCETDECVLSLKQNHLRGVSYSPDGSRTGLFQIFCSISWSNPV